MVGSRWRRLNKEPSDEGQNRNNEMNCVENEMRECLGGMVIFV